MSNWRNRLAWLICAWVLNNVSQSWMSAWVATPSDSTGRPTVADLVQIVHTAITDTADIPAEIEWSETYRDLVPASNLRRILDREHAKGRTPQADGWLHMPHACSSDTWRHQRIRWEDPRLLEAER